MEIIEKIKLRLFTIDFLSNNLHNVIQGFEQISNKEISDEFSEDKKKALLEVLRRITETSEELADFMNGNDITSEEDEKVVNGMFELLNK